MANRCTHWRLGEPRCFKGATHRFAFAGKVSRIAGAVCEEHGRAVEAEYAEKMPEMELSLVPADTHGMVGPGPSADVVDARGGGQ
jgi:hypothetical protein